jgi:prolyl-tRNA synthetase
MKRAVKIIEVVAEVGRELEDIQRTLLARASETLRASVRPAKSYDELKAVLAKEGGVVQAPWCGTPECEEKVKAETGAKIVNIPFDQPPEVGPCVLCGNPGKSIANFAKSY